MRSSRTSPIPAAVLSKLITLPVWLQMAEGLLQQFGHALAKILEDLRGAVGMDLPRQPLAMPAMLQLLSAQNPQLAHSNHPVIQVQSSC